MSELTLKPLYYADRLHEVNSRGDVGVITLWSPVRAVKRKLGHVAPELLDRERSRIAVIANLYGDGMPAMFCNLLFNPQITHLVAVGEDLGLSTCEEIEQFLRFGLEDSEMLGAQVKRVVGTNRIFPAVPELGEGQLRERLSFRQLGKLSQRDFGDELAEYLRGLPTNGDGATPERIRTDLPMSVAPDFAFRPSELTGHQVVRPSPLECWHELMVRVARFGRPVELRNGPRLELLNAKAVITNPVVESADTLSRFGFDLDRFLEYQEKILTSALPEGISYTYGNRLRGYFDQGSGGTDALQTVIDRLQKNPQTRHAYVSLWDTATDLPVIDGSSEPCLTTIWFRRTEASLSLAATFRAHSLLSAWLENVYGLMAIQKYVADRTDNDLGPITILSHSLGIDPRNPRYALAQSIEQNWKSDDNLDHETGKYSLREDPNGYFVVSADHKRNCIVAEHRFGTALVKRYESDRASILEREIAADMAVSYVSHALWLGGELTAKEQLLRGRKASADE